MHKNLSGPELSEQKFKWTEIKCRQIECVQSALQYIIYYYTIVCLLFSEMDSILNMATKSKWTNIQCHAYCLFNTMLFSFPNNYYDKIN